MTNEELEQVNLHICQCMMQSYLIEVNVAEDHASLCRWISILHPNKYFKSMNEWHIRVFNRNAKAINPFVRSFV